MNRDEAAERTIKGIWNAISDYVKCKIQRKCDEGEFEARFDKYQITKEDIERLEHLYYTVRLDDSDSFCPEYIINWEKI